MMSCSHACRSDHDGDELLVSDQVLGMTSRGGGGPA
jgi:hypothetical protein